MKTARTSDGAFGKTFAERRRDQATSSISEQTLSPVQLHTSHFNSENIIGESISIYAMVKKPNPSHAAQRSVSSTPKSGTPTPSSQPTTAPGIVASSAPTPRPAQSSTGSNTTSLNTRSSPQQIAQHVLNKYLNETPSRTLLLDAFMAFLVVVGVVQFAYCVLAGNYVCTLPTCFCLFQHCQFPTMHAPAPSFQVPH